ncbi:BolA domain UV induced protein Uvi31 [Friedmanniomyces endolithicus]|nr:BolA domain UV induced protein Uvi31 [Friedmanniomyces endolithicus]
MATSQTPMEDAVRQKLGVFVASDAFKSKMQPARHRTVYTLLKDELAAQGGIHALQLRTRAPEEEEKAKAKDAA